MNEDDVDNVHRSIVDLFDSIVDLQKTNPSVVQKFVESEIEAEILRIANGNEEKLLQLRRYQWNINKELRRFKDPVARMNKMAELFWAGVHKFRGTCSITGTDQKDKDT